MEPPPTTAIENVTDLLHGVSVADPYRWLENQNSPRTRAWIREQTQYTRTYLDSIPGRKDIRERVREFLAVENYDSVLVSEGRYFFRKHRSDQEQPCIYLREGAGGEDKLLLDPREHGGAYVSLKPLRVSPDARFLLYEVKEGGARTASYALFDIERRTTLSEILPNGYLGGFEFAPDGRTAYYVHEILAAQRRYYRAVYRHVLGTPFRDDQEIFYAGEDPNIRLWLIAGERRLGFIIERFLDEKWTDFYLASFEDGQPPARILQNLTDVLEPTIAGDRVFALTNRHAPNFRIVELPTLESSNPDWREVVPESQARIQNWVIVGEHFFVSYLRGSSTQVLIFDFCGTQIGEVPAGTDQTVRLLRSSRKGKDLLFETESFNEPRTIWRYSPRMMERTAWAQGTSALRHAPKFECCELSYLSNDGTQVPLFLVGRPEVLESGGHPMIMTSYGGFGIPTTPQFSVFAAFLMEHGCLFALPRVRGGSEFGEPWHQAGKRRNRQNAFNDFLSAAEMLIACGRTTPAQLAIFGGSNSGLLVGAALTQRPELFRAALCMAPLLDMLRYHFFDYARIWRDEFGTAEDEADFTALARYSPYHAVRDGVEYPAVMFVSGDADGSCNGLHARKMTARLQAANTSGNPIVIDYNPLRGHAATLPLSVRVEALTDRLAFFCDQLELRP